MGGVFDEMGKKAHQQIYGILRGPEKSVSTRHEDAARKRGQEKFESTGYKRRDERVGGIMQAKYNKRTAELLFINKQSRTGQTVFSAREGIGGRKSQRGDRAGKEKNRAKVEDSAHGGKEMPGSRDQEMDRFRQRRVPIELGGSERGEEQG